MFTSKFWAKLMGRLDVWLRKSTAFYPQTDGQTERVNQSLEQHLRQYCNYEQNNCIRKKKCHLTKLAGVSLVHWARCNRCARQPDVRFPASRFLLVVLDECSTTVP